MDSVCNEELEKLNKGNIRIINRDDEDFPQKLKEIHNPPKRLYIRGNLDGSINLNNKNIAIVGSRNMSTYGKEMARMLARDLSKAGVNIISGLAKGIDSQAHKGALEVGGYTVGVLGCGINVTYPRENIDLYTEIDKKGCIISEYGLDVKSFPGNFPMRNRIISALSDGVIVVEAKRKGGSLITAEYALEQGKQVYAVPGRAYDSNSEGTNNLLKMGALCVTSADDVLWDLMGGEMCRNANNFIDKEDDSKKDDLLNNRGDMNDIEKMIYDFLDLEPKYIDDIIQKSGIGITNTISTLYIMEEKNIIKQPVKGYYIISI